jgi:hypothetical protein
MPILGVIASSTSAGYAVGDYESIQTVTVGSGGAADIEFTSIPATYKHLQIRVLCRGTDASDNKNITFRFNSDTGTNYTFHNLQGDGLTVSAANGLNQTAFVPNRMPASTAASNVFGVAIIDILDYANTNKYKIVRAISGFDTNNGTQGSVTRINSGLWLNTSAITSIKGIMNSGNIAQYSSFALYGIK